MKKVIVIGLDGFEPKIVESMMAAGELPNFTRLKESGGYSRVRTTCPAQTPVAWSTFSTGTNPGGHGIYDFLSRDPRTYLPILGLSRYEQTNAFTPPKVVNMRRGAAVWDVLAAAGIPATVIRCPCTYPPDAIRGNMLAGVGVPDLRGGMGTSTFYTTDPEVQPGQSEKVVHIQRDENNVVRTYLIGPRNPRSRNDFQVNIEFRIEDGENRILIRSEGEPNELVLQLGRWSSWLRVKFKIGLFQSVNGVVRFYLKQIEPNLEFYASPINFDPSQPLFPISYPADYAKELENRLGIYCTLGMAEDHDGLINGRFDESAYLGQIADVLHERMQMMHNELARFEEGLFFCLYDTPDRLQHMFWRYREPQHPANQNGFQDGMGRAIEEHYRICDAIIGEALHYVDDQTLFITLSDHGMNSFQRGLNLNTWLFENGFLSLKDGVEPGEEAGDLLRAVDWSKTRAYALGLGAIFLNLAGREENGIVSAAETEKLKQAIKRGLTGLRDPERGHTAVRSVPSREEIYHGPYAHEAPDLVVNFSPGYRVSWATPLGGVPEGLFEDNHKRWGGDHVIDPELVPGVLFMNKPFNERKRPGLIDLAPTILAALNLPKGSAMEGGTLL